MHKKPELLTTAGSMEEMVRLLEAGADAVAVGDERYGMRLPGSFHTGDIRLAVKEAHGRGAKLYVVANNLMENRMLDGLPDYLKEVAAAGADALVFGDPAVLLAMREAGVSLPLHWNAEMLSTNWETANYWGRKGAVRAVLSRELNMEEVLEIKAKADVEIQVQVHGLTNIYHSKRTLVKHYRDHQGRAGTGEVYSAERGLYLVEAERQEEHFPVYEDRNGTHIMSSEDLCMLESLNELIEGGMDSLKIEGLLKTPEYNETVVNIYRQAIDAYAVDADNWYDPEWLERIESIQPADRPLSFGFFYKEQVY